MEVSESNLQQLAAYLQRTLSPDPSERRGAEKFLESIEINKNYSVLLLNIIDKADVPLHLRISASITFKNFIKRNWAVIEEGRDRIDRDDREIIKQNIVDIMLKSPDKIQKQLSDAISCIGKEDFPEKWPNLLQSMVEKFKTNDFSVIVGILHTAHSLFKRYRHEYKSDKLWREIKHVLDNFADPFTVLTKNMIEFAKTSTNNPDALRMVYNSLVLICKIFYSLNYQDLPEYFEDHMEDWVTHFHFLLTADSKLLATDDKDEPGVMEQVKTQVCDNLSMYAQKYDEEFSAHLPGFVVDVWHLLINTGVQAKYDLLVSNAIQFLASVAERTTYKKLFEEHNVLCDICEKVIVPNMEFRDADEEAFEENAEEYIRRDIEGSDVDTRRRAACDLVRALSKSFEEIVIQNFSVYIQRMLQLYSQDPKQYWKSKDAAIFLVTSLAAKAQTQKHGVTRTSQLVNVVEFFNNFIASELQVSGNSNPVIIADAIKYTMVFRTQLPREALVTAFPLLVHHLQSTSHVVHSYAACCIEKLLFMKPSQITKADLSSLSNTLVMSLFKALQVQGSEENEYIMKALMRSLHELDDQILPFLNVVVQNLLEKLNAVCKNPSKPNFNHFLFESLCITINVSCRVQPGYITSFEQSLFPIFQNILQQDVQEFVPYIFQVLSVMLERYAGQRVPDPYMALFPLLIQPSMWERAGNVPALVRLLQAYVVVGMATKQISDKLDGMLGVFQKLLASRTNDHFAFELLNCLTAHAPENLMSERIGVVFNLLFHKLTSSKTTKFVRCLIAFFSLYIIKYSPASLVAIIERLQSGMFPMVVEKVLVSDAASVNVANRKLCAVAMTRLLCDPVFLKDDSLLKFWVPLLQAVVQLLEHQTAVVEEGSDVIGHLTSEEFQTAYSHLAYSGKAEVDYCPDVPDAKINLARSLHAVCAAYQEMRLKLSTLQSDTQICLHQYFAKAGLVMT